MTKAWTSCGPRSWFKSAVQFSRVAGIALAIIALLVAVPQPATAQGKTIVVFAPHPDDEGLCCAGIISAAKAAGNTVKIVVVTNGDFYGYNTTAQREAETVAGMALLGVAESDIIFLGYGDQLMQTLFQSPSPTTVYTSAAGQTQTYATRGLGGVDYHTYLYGSPGPYNQQTALSDIEAALQNLHPDEIYTTSLWDDHPDHQATFTFVTQALLALRKQGVSLSPRIHETLIHAPCSSCGVPVNEAYLWPGGGANVLPRFNPGVIYSEPYYLTANTTYNWNRIENIPVPSSMQSLSQTANLKAQVVAAYPSQGGNDPNNYLFSFVKQNEFFWIHDYLTNIAGLATVTESTQTTDSGQLGTSAIDGFVEGDPDGYEPFEWATQGELNGAWIKLTWPNSVTISQVALYDRPNSIDNVISGTLHFSDGSTVAVGTLPNNGDGYLVSFPRKTVTSVQFTIDNAVGDNTGLAEMEVYGTSNGATVNHPQIFSGPTPSLPLQNDAYGQPYAAALTDAQTVNFSISAFDVNGQILTYNWAGSGGTFTGLGSNITFHPPVVSAPTLVTATVTVTDPQGASAQNTAFVTVTPSNSSGLSVSSLVFNPTSVASGSTATATVTLSGNATNGAIVALTSSNTAVASVPAAVTIPAGSNTATFPISTVYVSSTQTVTITAALGGSPRNSILTVLQPAVTLASLTPSAPTVGGGNATTATVTLSGAAPTGGAVIALSSNQTTVASVPATVTVPAGATSTNFNVTTFALTSATSVTLTASYVGGSTTTSLRVAPYVAPNLATVAAVTVSSDTPAYGQNGFKAVDGIVDGSPAPGDYTKEWATNGQLAGAWIRLTWPGGATVSQAILYDRPNLTDNVTSGTLSFSDGSSVPVGALPNAGSALSVTFPARTVTWMQFTVNSAVGINIGLAEIAAIGTISPASLSTVTLNPATIVGGGSSTGTVTLSSPAPSTGAVVNLTSSNTAVASVPTTVTVASGATSANFNITTSGVSSSTPVTISGTYSLTQSATLTVNPLSLASLTLSPSSVTGGTSATGTVTLAGAASGGGAVVSLSSNSSAGVVPATVTVPSGSTSANFTMTTNSVVTATSVTVTATYNGAKTASIWVTPAVNGGGMTQFATDNFARTNGPLGPNWSNVFDSGSAPAIVNQTVQSAYGRTEALYYGGINWPADQYAQAQITFLGDGSVGPAVRMTSNGTFYCGTVGSFGTGNANVYIMLDNDGGRSLVASSSNATVLANDLIQLSVQGTTLTLTNVTRGTTLLTATDSTVQAGYPGFYVGGSSGSAITNWSAGVTTSPLTLNTLATDSFNRADAPNLGSNWAVGPGLWAIQILNDLAESAGQGQPPNQGHGKEYYTAVTFPGDQWSQAQVLSSNGDINGAMVRYQGTTDTHYVGLVVQTGGPGTCSVNIDRDINGSPVLLISDNTYCSVTPGDYMRLQIQGTLLSYIDATTGTLLLTATDSQITGGSPGWSLNPLAGAPTASNWSGGKFGQ